MYAPVHWSADIVERSLPIGRLLFSWNASEDLSCIVQGAFEIAHLRFLLADRGRSLAFLVDKTKKQKLFFASAFYFSFLLVVSPAYPIDSKIGLGLLTTSKCLQLRMLTIRNITVPYLYNIILGQCCQIII